MPSRKHKVHQQSMPGWTNASRPMHERVEQFIREVNALEPDAVGKPIVFPTVMWAGSVNVWLFFKAALGNRPKIAQAHATLLPRLFADLVMGRGDAYAALESALRLTPEVVKAGTSHWYERFRYTFSGVLEAELAKFPPEERVRAVPIATMSGRGLIARRKVEQLSARIEKLEAQREKARGVVAWYADQGY